MSFGSGFAIYFVVWWITLFAVLPFGVRTQAEAGEIVTGAPASAPHSTRIGQIMIRNTIVASVVFAGIYWLLVYSGLSIMSVPLPGA
jgi:predicted secreted protein